MGVDYTKKYKGSKIDNSYTFEIWFYFIMYVIEVLLIKLAMGVESWAACLVLAATIGSLCTWGISHIPDIID